MTTATREPFIGENCACSSQAAVVYETDEFGDVAHCIHNYGAEEEIQSMLDATRAEVADLEAQISEIENNETE